MTISSDRAPSALKSLLLGPFLTRRFLANNSKTDKMHPNFTFFIRQRKIVFAIPIGVFQPNGESRTQRLTECAVGAGASNYRKTSCVYEYTRERKQSTRKQYFYFITSFCLPLLSFRCTTHIRTRLRIDILYSIYYRHPQ